MTVSVLGVGGYVPDRVVDNDELASRLDTTREWILERTGIAERRIAAAEQSTSDLGIEACRRALAAAGVGAAEVDLVICATSSPDWLQPATAAAIHGGLGMRPESGSVDVNAVCTGFVYAFDMAVSMLDAHADWSSVLVIGAECYSRIVDQNDRRTAVLFGDGAGAVLLGRSWNGAKVESSVFGSEPSGIPDLLVPAGGAREPATEAALREGRGFFTMRGPAVRDYALRTVPAAVSRACELAGVQVGDLQMIVPHQSNLRIMEQVVAELDVPPERVGVTVDRYGNTAAASIPLTLDMLVSDDRLDEGDLVCLVGYGGGLSWGALVLRWSTGTQ